MPGWTCPACKRLFARNKQSHECAPAMSLDQYFSTGPEFERPVYDAVMAHVRTLGEVHIEPVSVGIFVKRVGRYIQLRPMTKWVALSFSLPRTIHHPKISRKPQPYGRLVYHVVNLRSASEVDDDVRAWLTEAWAACD